MDRWWSREKLEALPPPERLRRGALVMWIGVALGIALGLQIAFIEGYRVVGLAMAGLGLLSLPSPLLMTLRARRLARQQERRR